MKSFQELVDEIAKNIAELMPWDLEEKLKQATFPMLLDVREADEFTAMHIKGSMNIPRGILEVVCDLDNKETAPDFVNARDKEIVVICGSGKRSLMAASTMDIMGYKNIFSLKTGLKGWNDADLPLVDHQGDTIDPELVAKFLSFNTKPTQFTHR